MVESSTSRFQMSGARAAILDGPFAEVIEQQIDAIENAMENVPDFAFDLSKTLIESVCKTVLADIGQPAERNWNALKLLKETTNRLKAIAQQPSRMRPRQEIRWKRRYVGCSRLFKALCEFRNSYGMASHGRDAFSARLGRRQAALAAQAADTIVSFLYRTHREALRQNPGARIYYEDHGSFNDAFDNDNGTIRVSDLGLRPSEVLFRGDPEDIKPR